MAASISPYTAGLTGLINQTFGAPLALRVALLSGGSFSYSATSASSILTASEISAGSGYLAGGQDLTSINAGEIEFGLLGLTADEPSWTADGGSITANAALVYHSASNTPVAYVDFDGVRIALDGIDFVILWNEDGIISWQIQYP